MNGSGPRWSGVLALTALLLGCATPQPPTWTRLGDGPTYTVGRTRVHILPQADVERACRSLGARPASRSVVMGCYHASTDTLYAVPDVWVLLHEFKHRDDGAWHP